jgi:polysaccharide biosynthesis transport protein
LQMNCLATLPTIKPSARDLDKTSSSSAVSNKVMNCVNADDPILNFAVKSPLSQYTEALRSVKVAVDLNGILKTKKIIGFTSTFPNEGKTTVSTNFARLLAHGGSRAILIDADLRNPSLSNHLAPKAKSGLVDVLANRCTEADVQLIDQETGLIFMPTGQTSKLVHTAELLSSEKMKKLIEKLNEAFDYVILDLPPLSPIVDVRMTTSFVDSYVLIVEWGRTQISAVERATSSASEVRDRILGVVLNKANPRVLARYDSYRSLAYGRKYNSRYGYVD